MSRAEIAMINEREEMLDILIKKYGFESEPTLYFAKYAWEDIYNAKRFFNVAIGWIFIEEK